MSLSTACRVLVLLSVCWQVLAIDDKNPFGDCAAPTGDQLCVGALGNNSVRIHKQGDQVAKSCFDPTNDAKTKCKVLLIGDRSEDKLRIKWRIYVDNRDKKKFLFAIFRQDDDIAFKKLKNSRHWPDRTPVIEHDPLKTKEFVTVFNGIEYDHANPTDDAYQPYHNVTSQGRVVDGHNYELYTFDSSTTLRFTLTAVGKTPWEPINLNGNTEKAKIRVLLSNQDKDFGLSDVGIQLFSEHELPTTTASTTLEATTPVDEVARTKKYRIPYMIALSVVLLLTIVGLALYYYLVFRPRQAALKSTSSPPTDNSSNASPPTTTDSGKKTMTDFSWQGNTTTPPVKSKL